MKEFERHLKLRYGLTPADVEKTEAPGYWRKKELCGGAGVCNAEIHTFLFNEGPMHHNVCFFDSGRDEKGRFVSPYRTWKECEETTP